jgi:hypothetical protein
VNKKPKNRSAKKRKDTQDHFSSKPHSTKLGKPFAYENPRPPKPTTHAHKQTKQNKQASTNSLLTTAKQFPTKQQQLLLLLLLLCFYNSQCTNANEKLQSTMKQA